MTDALRLKIEATALNEERSSLVLGDIRVLGLPGEVFSASQSALLYIIYDPLAPNWRIEEQRLDDDTYAFSLQAKSFRIGGDGEGIAG